MRQYYNFMLKETGCFPCIRCSKKMLGMAALEHWNTVWKSQFLTQNRTFCWNIFPILLSWLRMTSSCSVYKILTEKDTFWVIGGGVAAYVTHTNSSIRRCISEMLPNVAEKNSFVYCFQRELLWGEHHLLIDQTSFNLQSHSWTSFPHLIQYVSLLLYF
jgi:hypothetical protein